MGNNIETLFEELTRKAANFDYFLAKVFVRYQKLEGLTPSDLARMLGCTVETFNRIALCRRPNSENANEFKSEVGEIASRFSIDPDKLANIIRYVDTMDCLINSQHSMVSGQKPGMLLTARDQEKPNKEKKDAEDKGSEDDAKKPDKEDDIQK
jgi:hypothetical protein